MDPFCQACFALMDALRRLQGDFFSACALGPMECSYRVLASGPHWRLRAYGEAGGRPSLLIVAAHQTTLYLGPCAVAQRNPLLSQSDAESLLAGMAVPRGRSGKRWP